MNLTMEFLANLIAFIKASNSVGIDPENTNNVVNQLIQKRIDNDPYFTTHSRGTFPTPTACQSYA